MLHHRMFVAFSAVIGLWMALPSAIMAQGGPPPSLRPYWHVFIAYLILWILVAGWVISIAKRLGRIEKQIGDADL
jgi:CcmD family protein